MSDREFYESGQYDSVGVSTQGGKIAGLFHDRVEAGISPRSSFPRVLEVGALNGQHLPYVKHHYDEWNLLDIIPTDKVFDDPRVRFTQGDAEHLPFDDDTFDRVLTTCVLHHLENPHQALSEMRRVTRPGGIITVFLPIDPGLPYELSHELTSVRAARKQGLVPEIRKARALGHRNHYKSLRWQILDVFGDDEMKQSWWPMGVPIAAVNIFRTFQVTKSPTSRA